jgi:hypothetical protein
MLKGWRSPAGLLGIAWPSSGTSGRLDLALVLLKVLLQHRHQ